MYLINASLTRHYTDGSESSRQVPTFFLDENSQGLINEAQVKKVARQVIDPFYIYEVRITVQDLDGTPDNESAVLQAERKASFLHEAHSLGYQYARSTYSPFEPLENPLSGEWADGPTVESIAGELGIDPDLFIQDDDENTEILLEEIGDAWEKGYREYYTEMDEHDDECEGHPDFGGETVYCKVGTHKE